MAVHFPGFDTESLRKPGTPTVFNAADNIERQMQADGHRKWGWIIYRSTYDSEEDWEEFLARLRARVERSLRFSGGLDMLDTLDFKIFEDRDLFDGASTATVREHFKTWTAHAPLEEQNAGSAESQRYQFCIQVDDEALHSVVHDAPPPSHPDASGRGWVKLIWRDWELNEADLRDGGEEVVDGLKVHDIGWSRAAYQFVLVGIYCMMRGQNEWHREYRRPPAVILP